ncbi:hypothetical protein M8C21_024805 [Ambrosia artemisiifolia]|uniref:FAD-binding PCMH-type domain-containing protein n=1 Tax=Ambrosia artemisiifolia TaxID=4212 RepID=A0AAD5D6E7_AMBAR|nr:hypothetical protein M8C21_024805 [Ambrosia artemisiifolia]
MSSVIFISLLLFFFVPYSFSRESGQPFCLRAPGPSVPDEDEAEPDSIRKSFLECLPTKSPEPDPSWDSIVFSFATNPSEYTQTLQNRIKNRRFNVTNTPKPAIIVTPKKESHVQAAVRCAKQLNIHMKIRSGGHDYEAVSYVSSEKTFMVLDMFNFGAVDVDIPTETAVVQVGAQLGALYYRIWEKSKVHGFPAGACPTVGAGGHISGGGYGTMIRKYGLTVDHVIDAKIVDVNGEVMDRKIMGEDLFWAIRGAGGSSFCVILSFTVKLVRVPEVNTVFRVQKFGEQNMTDVLAKWQSVMPTMDNDLFIRVLLQPVTVKKEATIRTTFMALFLGDSNRLIELTTKTFPELGLKKEDCFEVSWIQAALYWANYDVNNTKPEVLLDNHSDKVKYLERKADYVQTPIPNEGLLEMFKKLNEVGDIGLVFNPYGGKMDEVPADATPMPHRAGNLYKIQYSVNWEEPGPEATDKHMSQARAMFEFMTPYVSKNPRGAYLNYRDLDVGVNSGDGFNSGKVYGEKYFKGNFERLVKVKSVVDPDNFFRNEQSIPTMMKTNI